HGKAFAQKCLQHGIYVGYPATYMSNASMNEAFFEALEPALDLALADYCRAEDMTTPFTDASMVEYCMEAFRTTEKACLSNKHYWA
ncbi:aminotransferase, partial [Paraburkholderia sp. EG304]